MPYDYTRRKSSLASISFSRRSRYTALVRSFSLSTSPSPQHFLLRTSTQLTTPGPPSPDRYARRKSSMTCAVAWKRWQEFLLGHHRVGDNLEIPSLSSYEIAQWPHATCIISEAKILSIGYANSRRTPTCSPLRLLGTIRIDFHVDAVTANNCWWTFCLLFSRSIWSPPSLSGLLGLLINSHLDISMKHIASK